MNLLFLDIDGVLNSAEDHDVHEAWWDMFSTRLNDKYVYGKFSGDFMSKKKLEILSSIIEKYDFKLVGTSSWFSTRYTPVHFTQTTGLLMEETTSFTGGGQGRGESVDEHIRLNNPTKVIILDDSWQEMYSLEQQEKYCVGIDGRYGLSDYHLEDIEHLLSKQED